MQVLLKRLEKKPDCKQTQVLEQIDEFQREEIKPTI